MGACLKYTLKELWNVRFPAKHLAEAVAATYEVCSAINEAENMFKSKEIVRAVALIMTFEHAQCHYADFCVVVV